MRKEKNIGKKMWNWAKDLFPINRSITGPGVRDTLNYINKKFPDLKIHKVKSGTKAFDWIVPNEWIIKDAYIKDKNGNKIIDFRKNNLHVIGYSSPINKVINLKKLKPNLFSLPNKPNAVPYLTSYYKHRWGFCLTHKQKLKLKNGNYKVFIDSKIKPGYLNYGELIIPGKSKKEIILSTNICHPSMANNELSGPVVSMALAKWISSIKNRRYSYRILFLPETIGSIVFLSRNLKALKKNTLAGFVLTCMGDERIFSYLPSRSGDTLADKAAKNVLNYSLKKYKEYSYLDRGSDERQYCSPKINLPFCSVMRSKYGTYPEYHTSLDNLKLVTPKGLEGSYQVLKKIIELIEVNYKYDNIIYCEPNLGKRGMYPTLSDGSTPRESLIITNILAYADGDNDLFDISNLINEDAEIVNKIIKKLLKNKLIKRINK